MENRGRAEVGLGETIDKRDGEAFLVQDMASKLEAVYLCTCFVLQSNIARALAQKRPQTLWMFNKIARWWCMVHTVQARIKEKKEKKGNKNIQFMKAVL